MATTTTNLVLRKPAGTDTVDETLDLNDNWDTIDAKFAATTPSTQAIGDAAAGGSQLTIARSDHKHGMPGFGVPSTQAIGDAVANGVATTIARSDHKHGLPAFAVPVSTGGANAEGSATTLPRSDHVHAAAALSFGTPGTQAIGDAPANGASPTVPRSDHVHGMPTFATPVDVGAAAAAGSAATLPRSDHVHGLGAASFGVPSTQAIGDAVANGVATTAARSDHKHGLPAFATPVDVGAANAAGSAATLARSDHVHGSGVFAGNTASAATVALPTGRYIPITGTATITSITGGVTGREITLIFASRGCTVDLGASHIMQGPYISDVGGTLSLFHDGTIWREVGRAGFVVPGARYYLSAATTSIVLGADRVITWTVNGVANGGLTAVPVANIVPGIIGRWGICGSIVWDDTPAGEIRSGHLRKGGVNIRRLFDMIFGDVNDSNTSVFTTKIEVTSITDSYDMILFTTATNDIRGGTEESHMAWHWIGK